MITGVGLLEWPVLWYNYRDTADETPYMRIQFRFAGQHGNT